MAITATLKDPNNRPVAIRVAGDSSYPTGGSVLPAGTIPGGQFVGIASSVGSSVGTRVYNWNNLTQKLQAYDAFATEEGNATDCSADVIMLFGFVV